MLSWVKDKIKGVKSEHQCLFCNMLKPQYQSEQNTKRQKFLYEDQKYFAIHDINKASAKQHILVITKKHIRSALDVKERQTIMELKTIAEQVLEKLSTGANKFQQKQVNLKKDESANNKYRFGFHLPPYNSIDHIHLHGFQLPIQDWKSRSFTYGWMMSSIQDILNMIK